MTAAPDVVHIHDELHHSGFLSQRLSVGVRQLSCRRLVGGGVGTVFMSTDSLIVPRGLILLQPATDTALLYSTVWWPNLQCTAHVEPSTATGGGSKGFSVALLPLLFTRLVVLEWSDTHSFAEPPVNLQCFQINLDSFYCWKWQRKRKSLHILEAVNWKCEMMNAFRTRTDSFSSNV